MKITHRFVLTGLCPRGGRDHYRVTVETSELFEVEKILAVAEKLTRKPIFQEDLTAKLARELGAKVQTVGMHGPVQTEVEA